MNRFNLPGKFAEPAAVAARTGNFDFAICRVAMAEFFEADMEIWNALFPQLGFDLIAYGNFDHLWEDMPAFCPHVVLTHNHVRGRGYTYEPAFYARAIRDHRDANHHRYPRWGASFREPGDEHPLEGKDYLAFFREHFDFTWEWPVDPKHLVGHVVGQLDAADRQHLTDNLKSYLAATA